MIILVSLSAPTLAAEHADFISSPSEAGSPAFHPHMVRPGSITSYIIRVKNIWYSSIDVQLAIDSAEKDQWQIELEQTNLAHIMPGDYRDVLVNVRPPAAITSGESLEFKVVARSSNGFEDGCALSAKTTLNRKIYFVSVDSLSPAYFKLDAAGTGYGKDGDWLMPNAHRLMDRGIFYPNFLSQIVTASDTNHFNILAGTLTGTGGVPSLIFSFYGFDGKGRDIVTSDTKLKATINTYDSGKHVPSLFNAVKTEMPGAWTSYVTGAEGPERVIDFPESQIDRAITGINIPDWLLSLGATLSKRNTFFKNTLAPPLPGAALWRHRPISNPEGAHQPFEPPKNFFVSKGLSLLHSLFPPDRWIVDSAMLELLNEDPDVMYILLSMADDSGHAFGAAWDLDEWKHKEGKSIAYDVSKYDSRASRQSMLNNIRAADLALGRFLDLLEKRGQLDEVILVFESDHSQVTQYQTPLDPKKYFKTATSLSQKKDFFFATALSTGFVNAWRDDSTIIPEVERALEAWRVNNPLTGTEECPVLVYNHEEMKTGFDHATGKQWMLPNEYYSEYFIEHRKEGDQYWPDLLLLATGHWKFKVQNLDFGSLGIINSQIKVPEFGYLIGGHGNFETRPATLVVKVPGINPGIRADQLYSKDIAPTIYRLEGWPIPDSVNGQGLPGVDPVLGNK